jgi:phage terminase small subunit
MAGLTPKQQAFVNEYLIDLNATQAAIRAGYSEDTATEMGYENLRKPHIKKAIDDALAERSERVKLDAQWVLERL